MLLAASHPYGFLRGVRCLVSLLLISLILMLNADILRFLVLEGVTNRRKNWMMESWAEYTWSCDRFREFTFEEVFLPH